MSILKQLLDINEANQPSAAELTAQYGKGTWARVTYRQEGGDDGYQYVLRVDGKAKYSGLTLSSAKGEKLRAVDELAKKGKLGKYAETKVDEAVEALDQDVALKYSRELEDLCDDARVLVQKIGKCLDKLPSNFSEPARAYWFSHLKAAIGNTQHQATMDSTVESLKKYGEADPDE